MFNIHFLKYYKNRFFVFYIALIASLFLYSFTQVDLGLTLSRSSLFLTIEKSFQYIGYFNRPLSTLLYTVLLLFLFLFYGLFLKLGNKNKLTRKQVWILLFITTAILTFSYNAFSYDLFNYIFDAKIITYYHQNPYMHKALDFPQDKMLGFMHWTQRTYPYGPVWLALTIPLSYSGLQIFLVTFFLFKLLMSASFLGTCYYIEKISKKLFPKNSLFNLVFFAFNPLVLIESVVSAHLDIVMIFFAMIAVWFLINKKYILTGILLSISIGIKYAIVFLIPVFILVYLIMQGERRRDKEERKNIILSSLPLTLYPLENLFLISSILMISAVISESYWSGNFQPWYLVPVLSIAVFLAKKIYVIIPTIIISFFALLQYALFLSRGDWNPPVPTILYTMLFGSILLSIFVTLAWRYRISNS